MTPADAARVLALLPRTTRLATCPVCGARFLAKGRGKYDRPACRKLAWWRARRGKTKGD